jgi:hypothetical protein
MRNSRNLSIVLLFVLLAAVLQPIRRVALEAWMRHEGNLAPVGTSTEGFMGKPGAVLSIMGVPLEQAEQGSFGPPQGVYHVLILFPGDSVSGAELSPGEFETGTDNRTSAEAQAWKVWSGQPGHERAVRRVFTTRYNGYTGKAELVGHRYSLANGNMFVVRYDTRGRVSVRQLRHTYRNHDMMKPVVDVFQALLPSDPAVRNLLDYSAKPCPRRQAAPARGTAEA